MNRWLKFLLIVTPIVVLIYLLIFLISPSFYEIVVTPPNSFLYSILIGFPIGVIYTILDNRRTK